MAGNTWVTDLTHFLDALDPAASLPAPARKLAAFFGSIVHELTCHPRAQPRVAPLTCRRSRCHGRIVSWIESLATVRWSCDTCDDQGLISNWRATPWDMTGKPPAERDLPRQTQPSAPPPPKPPRTSAPPPPKASPPPPPKALPPPSGTNVYCERLGLPTPRLEGVLGAKRLKVREAMIVALLERGGPMSVEELAARLEAAGMHARSGDMALSIRKAWRGLPPVEKSKDERYSLDVGDEEWRYLPYSLGLKRTPAAEAVVVPERGPDEPLTKEEVEAAFERGTHPMGDARKAAAILDAHGGALSVAEVQEHFARVSESRRPLELTDQAVRLGGGDLVRLADGRASLNPASPALGTMRTAVRKLARPGLTRKAQEGRWAERRVERDQEQRVAAAQANSYTRALLRVVPAPDDVQAAAVLDLQDRSIRTFVGTQLAELPAVVAGYDVLVGLHPREALEALGVDPARFKRVIDLRPPKKSRRLNKAGRTLRITPELLITSSTGMSRPLGDPEKIAQYLAEGDHGKLERRLSSDLKALFAFYRYGVLQRGVRLRWGFLDDGEHVSWELPGEPSLYETIKAAAGQGQTVELVVGNAPGWEEPWSRAQRFRACGVDHRDVIVEGPDGRARIPRVEVQAVRVVP